MTSTSELYIEHYDEMLVLGDEIKSRDSRIAELEAQNKRLVEALGDTNAALIVTANDLSRHGGYAGENAYKIVTNARALLAELTA